MSVSISRMGRAWRLRARARATAVPLMPSLQRRRLQCYLAIMIGDIVALLASFAASGYVYLGDVEYTRSLVMAQLLLPIYLTVALYQGAYSQRALGRGRDSVVHALLALAISTAAVTFIVFFTRSSNQFSRFNFLLGATVGGLALTWIRLQMRAFVRWRCGAAVINQLVIDDGGPVVSMASAYHVSAEAFGLRPSLSDPHALDRIGLVMRNADRVIVSSLPGRRADWAVILKGANVEGEVIDETVAQLSALGARRVGHHGLLRVSTGPLATRHRVAKRLFDIAVAGAALLLLSPLMIVVALLIKLEDRGPVFFVQRRVGRGNRFFPIFKFRSMTQNKAGKDGTVSASKSDQRVTRIGRLIRSTSIDELPQLINVLTGDMSIVGPRPHAIGSQAGEKLFWEVDARYWQRHALKPGITGLAQVRGFRGATDCEEDLSARLVADLEYLDGWSIWRDLWIILATFGVLVHDRAF